MAITCFLSIASLGGCATSLQPFAGAAETGATVSERVALNAAAGAIERSFPWPKPTTISWMDRLAGNAIKTDSLSRADAISKYAEALREKKSPFSTLQNDARSTLKAAYVLIDAAENALESLNPKMSDVAILETSIQDLRNARGLYLAAIKEIDVAPNPDDADYSREAVDRVRSDVKLGFDRVMRRIGGLADALADRAAEQSNNFASLTGERS